MSAGRRITVEHAGRQYIGLVLADGTVRDLRVSFTMNHATAGPKRVERAVARSGKIRRIVVPMLQHAARLTDLQ